MNDALVRYIKMGVSVGVVTVMVLLSEILREPEIIFPEIAALAVGMLVSEKRAWKTTPARTLVLMSFAAFAGYLIGSDQGMPVYPKVIVVFVICAAALLLTRCTMLPMISAALLPILIPVRSIIYPLSVIIFTSGIILLNRLFRKLGIAGNEKFRPIKINKKQELIHWGVLLGVLMIVAAVAVGLNIPLMIAPPLVVLFVEFSYTDSPVRKSPLMIYLLTCACAVIGSCTRLILCILLGMPLTVGVFAAAAAAICLLSAMKRLFPPAAALAVLPFIISETDVHLYPFEVMIGAGIFIAAAMLYGGVITEGKKDKNEVLL
ncbi:MAG: hypothetical protein IJ861_05175 [Clostridia bacterium]|nr:hypothetical protein [Clostridia bacterium]